MVLAEAMACGIPVVTTTEVGMSDAIETAGAGLVVEPGNVKGLANALLALLRSPDEAASMGRNGRALVEQKFSTEQVARGVRGHISRMPSHIMRSPAWLASLLRDNAVLWVGMMVLNMATYGGQLFVARALGQAELGSYAAAAALVNLFFLPTAGIQTLAAAETARRSGADHADRRASYIGVWMKRGALLGMVLALLFIGASGFITGAMRFGSSSSIALLASGAVPALCLPLLRGMWQGERRFASLSSNLMVEGLFRILALVLIANVAKEGAPAALSYGIAAFGALIVGLMIDRAPLRRLQVIHVGWDVPRGAGATMMASVCLMLLLNVDLLAARGFLDPSAAGAYAAVTLVGRVALFAAASVPFVVLPRLVTGAKTDFMSLFVGLLLVAVICMAVLLASAVRFDSIDNIIFGNEANLQIYVLGTYGLAVLFYSLLNVVASYYFAAGSNRIAGVMLFAVVLECTLLVRFHATGTQVAGSMAVALLVALVIVAVDLTRSGLPRRAFG